MIILNALLDVIVFYRAAWNSTLIALREGILKFLRLLS